MPLFEDCKAAARASRHLGEDYTPTVKAEIARLEEEYGETLNAADIALVLSAPFN